MKANIIAAFSVPDTLATGILFLSDYSIGDKARTRRFIGPRPRGAEVEGWSEDDYQTPVRPPGIAPDTIDLYDGVNIRL